MVLSINLIAILIGFVVFLVGAQLVGLAGKGKKVRLTERLTNTEDEEINDILKDDVGSGSLYGKFHGAYISPYLRSNPNLIQTLSRTMGLNMELLDSKLREAKLEKAITAEEILSMKLMGFTALGVFLSIGLSVMNLSMIILGVLCYFIGSIMPQRWVETRIKARREEIERSLPDFLELLRSVTEAGLVIQEAITKVSARTQGALSDEFKNVMIETKSNGGQWRVAMENMAFRNDIDALSDVVSDILIAYDRGTAITETLAKEAQMMRQLYNARVQEKAKKLTVKAIIPMAIFGFFPLLILMLAPMLMQLGNNLGR